MITKHATPRLRLYLRRSKADEGHQQFSLDVQRDGCQRFALDVLPTRGIKVAWDRRVEYVDDDRAGDDFLGRAELQRLLKDVRQGDVVLCRDQSRLGRDALEVTLATRDLVRDSGARLIYYITGQEVPFNNAIDGATVFIQGTGHQMELEAIRSRTREALRARVRVGRIAGGRCYGYRLVRQQDSSGREFTTAEIDEEEAKVVRRIFAEYVQGRGQRSIAVLLNAEGVPAPSAGRRGSGSWAPGCVRSMLLNSRYRGEYRHGRIQRVRRGGRRAKVIAPDEEIIVVPMPAWRIIDDATWNAVQVRFAGHDKGYWGGPNTRYALSGLAKCGTCGGSIGVANTKISGGARVKAYLCYFHYQRGKVVCPVSVRQPIYEVENALCDFLQREVLTPATISDLMSKVRAEVERQTSGAKADKTGLERELARLRAEQKNLIKVAAAGGEDVAELVADMRVRGDRMRRLEVDLAAAARTPDMASDLLQKVEKAVRAKLHALGTALAKERSAARDAFQALFPDGLVFRPVQAGRRRVFEVCGTPRLGGGAILESDPTGNRTRDFNVRG